MFIWKSFLKSKAYKEMDDETREAIEEVLDTEQDTEVTEEDIEELIEENVKLREEVANLKAKVKELEEQKEYDKVEGIVSKAVDELEPVQPVVKENIMRDINIKSLKLKDGKVDGLDDILRDIKKKYKGLLKVENDDDGGDSINSKSFNKSNSGIKINVDTSKSKSKATKRKGIFID